MTGGNIAISAEYGKFFGFRRLVVLFYKTYFVLAVGFAVSARMLVLIFNNRFRLRGERVCLRQAFLSFASPSRQAFV
ncbi:MAG TPA: hypothetical protein DCS87_13505 [Rheinheimera sp.]|nr:hypothetical protein [Rheinheimera sp.]